MARPTGRFGLAMSWRWEGAGAASKNGFDSGSIEDNGMPLTFRTPRHGRGIRSRNQLPNCGLQGAGVVRTTVVMKKRVAIATLFPIQVLVISVIVVKLVRTVTPTN